MAMLECSTRARGLLAWDGMVRAYLWPPAETESHSHPSTGRRGSGRHGHWVHRSARICSTRSS